jgi:acyl dehydratase
MIRTEIPRDVYFDEIVIGERFRTPSRIISEQDIRAFCTLTGDHHPLHTDSAYARSKGFPGIIVHGLLCLSVMEGLKTQSGLYEHTSVASLGWEQVKFHAPVIADDVVYVEFGFDAKRPSSKGGRGVVTESVQLINQNGRMVVSATHMALVVMRNPSRRD